MEHIDRFGAIMKILVVICLIWFLFISWMEIRKDKKRGTFLVAFVIIGAAIVSFGEQFGFDGELAALIFAGITVVIYFYFVRT